MSKYRIEISEEARQAFESALEIQGWSESAKVSIITTCLPLFAMGYASAQHAAERGAKQCLERLEAREKLAQDLNYPSAWDTAVYPNVESAAIEALHAANVEAKEFAKRLAKEPKDAHYTMDQMRDYAAGVFTTRLYSVVHALEEKIRESVITAATLQADSSRALNDSPGAYRMIAAELRTIADNAKALGSKPFQKRAQYWAKKCFGLTLAMDRNERNQRFAEEALELVQACGMSERAVLGAVAYVYNRPVGEKRQEVGGTYTTLALLCAANGIDMVAEGEKDLLEIDNDETSARIREKRRTKPDFSDYALREI
jgi:hypothetical protein